MSKRETIVVVVIVLVVAVFVVIARGSTSDEAPARATSGAKCGGPYVGLSTKAAIEQAEDSGAPWRIGSKDGESFPVTLDYDPTRATFSIEDGKVTSAVCG